MTSFLQQVPPPTVAPHIDPALALTGAIGIGVSVIGFFLRRTLSDLDARLQQSAQRIQGLNEADHEIALQIAKLPEELAERFVGRSDYLQSITALSAKVDRVGEHVSEIGLELKIRRANEPK